MVAIVSGNSLGLNLTSLGVLGGKGVLGDAAQGRAGEAGYVNIANGNLVLQDQDDRLVGRGGGVAAVRTYNSQGLMTDDNGDNWSLGTFLQQIRLSGTVNTAGSVLTRTDRDGSQSSYTWDAAKARYVSTAGGGAYDTITHDAANARYIWTDGESRRVEHYESAATGRLLQVIDPSGNTATYSYNANNTLASVVTASGEATYFDYSGTNLSQIRVVAGGVTQTRTRYAYDASNRLSSVTVDLSPADNAVADGKKYVTTYSYDGASKRIASVVQTDGSSLTFTYVQVGTEYRVASATDAQGRITRYSYDTANRRTTVTDPLGLTTVYAYDAAGQLLQISYPAVGGVSQTVGFAYNAAGDVISVTDGQGNKTTMGYDAAGNQSWQQDAAGNLVTRTYDSRNQLLTETVSGGSGPTSVNLTTRRVYAATGVPVLRFLLDPEGRVTEYRYDSYGQRTATIEYAGDIYSLSALNESQVPSEVTLVSWAGGQDKTRIRRSDYTYDARGQLTSSTAFVKTDSAGVGISDGTQTRIQYVYGRSGELLQKLEVGVAGLTTCTYDGLGRLLSTQDALGKTTLTSYDDANRRTVLTQANGLISTSTYDAGGRLLAVAHRDAASLGLGTTQYVYDAGGRLSMMQDPTGVRSWVLYDEAGRKSAAIDANGTLTEYRYNKNNQVTRTITYATAVNVAGLVDAQGMVKGRRNARQ